MDVYKSRLLGYVEYRTPVLYHATSTTLSTLDAIQPRLLRAVGCTELEALMVFNLAPLATRRDIAMLGVVHRTVLGKGLAHFSKFFKRAQQTQRRHLTRNTTRRHCKQLEDPRVGRYSELVRRSALGLVAVYNLLPEEVVLETIVKGFQTQLQGLVKKRAEAGCENWGDTLSPRVPLWRHPLK